MSSHCTPCIIAIALLLPALLAAQPETMQQIRMDSIARTELNLQGPVKTVTIRKPHVFFIKEQRTTVPDDTVAWYHLDSIGRFIRRWSFADHNGPSYDYSYRYSEEGLSDTVLLVRNHYQDSPDIRDTSYTITTYNEYGRVLEHYAYAHSPITATIIGHSSGLRTTFQYDSRGRFINSVTDDYPPPTEYGTILNGTINPETEKRPPSGLYGMPNTDLRAVRHEYDAHDNLIRIDGRLLAWDTIAVSPEGNVTIRGHRARGADGQLLPDYREVTYDYRKRMIRSVMVIERLQDTLRNLEEFDTAGRPVFAIRRFYNPREWYKVFTSYDQYGNIATVRKAQYSNRYPEDESHDISTANDVTITEYKRDYDRYGNWTEWELINYSADGEVLFRHAQQYREITYYSND